MIKNEADLQRKVLEFLREKKIIHWRQSLGGVIQHVNNHKMILKSNPMAGFPDLAGLTVTGRFWAMELKTEKGKLSLQQKFWIEKLKVGGALVDVVRSLEEAERFISLIES